MPLVRAAMARRGLAIAFLAQALQYGAGLLMLPFVVTHLSPAETGIWYVFLAAQGLAAVADFGLQPTLSRHISAARSGATQIERHGFSGTATGTSNDPLVASLIAAARRVYLFLACGIFLILATGGSLYIASLARAGNLDTSYTLFAWLVFSGGIAGSLYLLWIPSLLLGSGQISQNYSFLLVSRGGIAAFGIIGLALGGGLMTICAGYLFTQIVARAIATPWLRRIWPRNNAPVSAADRWEILSNIWPNAARMGLVGVGAFLITRSTIFVISSFYGLPASASFAISLQLFSGLNSVAQLPMQIRLPAIVQARMRGGGRALRRTILPPVLTFLAIYVLGLVVILSLGQIALESVGSNVRLLAPLPLALLAIVMLLEGNHSLHAFVITTANRVPFVVPAILSGAGVVAGTVAAGWLQLGLVGIIAAQGIVQLCYNNWKWPLMVWQEFRHVE